jgi:glycosyltransferase involved in cell wall biosynthesis
VFKKIGEKGTNSRRGGKVVFASSGRLEINLKGYDIALKSLSRARDLSGSNNFEYHLAGAGPDEERLKNLAAGLGLMDQVRFRGWLESNELVELLHRCDVFIHPALYDPFPVAVLEAMAAGAVVLGSDASGSVRDRIVDGVNGFVHSAGNVQQLARQIANLMENPGRISMIGERARQTAEEWPALRGVAIIESIFPRYC